MHKKVPRYIFLIGIDTLRADHLSCYGYRVSTSPHIDTFAKKAILFRKSIAQSSWTLPSFASIFTSLYYHEHKSGFPCFRDEEEDSLVNTTILDESFTTIAEVLKLHGYKTAAFTEGALMSPFFGIDQGFDLFRICSVPQDRLYELTPKQIFFKDIKNVVTEAIRWIRKNKTSSLFVFLHSYETHAPLRDPMAVFDFIRRQYEEKGLMEDYENQFELKGELAGKPVEGIYKQLILYDAEIRYMDNQIGRFFYALKEIGIFDESMIIFTSDHGEEFGEHGGWGHGKTLYQESIFVPLIVKLPYQHRGMVQDKWTAQGIDIFPTILQICNIHDGPAHSGRSLLSKPRVDVALSHLFVKGKNLVAIIRNNKKLIYNYDVPEVSFLFDLGNDPAERNSRYFLNEDKTALQEFLEPVKVPVTLEEGCLDFVDERTKMRLRSLGYIQ